MGTWGSSGFGGEEEGARVEEGEDQDFLGDANTGAVLKDEGVRRLVRGGQNFYFKDFIRVGVEAGC